MNGTEHHEKQKRTTNFSPQAKVILKLNGLCLQRDANIGKNNLEKVEKYNTRIKELLDEAAVRGIELVINPESGWYNLKYPDGVPAPSYKEAIHFQVIGMLDDKIEQLSAEWRELGKWIYELQKQVSAATTAEMMNLMQSITSYSNEKDCMNKQLELIKQLRETFERMLSDN